MSDPDAEGEAEPVSTPLRAPESATAAAPEHDATSDTVVVRRGVGRRPVGERSDRVAGDDSGIERRDPALAAYRSRAAAPMRGSRRASAGGEADARARAPRDFPVPDTEAIARGVRARARRRLLAVVLAIGALVVVLLVVLAALLFAVGR